MTSSIARRVAALQSAIDAAGSQSALAARLGKQTGHIYGWLQRGVPATHCPAIERFTRELGKPVLCEDLCPDVDWSAIRSGAVGSHGAECAPAKTRATSP